MSSDLIVAGNEIATQAKGGNEVAIASAEASARYEMEGAVLMAKKFPRNEDQAFASLSKSCGRMTFAEQCCYSYPRGGEQISGPSVYLAKEGARCWGNIRFGFDVIRDDGETRHIRGWAWDLETNTKASYDASFGKLVFRKKGGWVKPDERDLRELTNRNGAFLVRNCILDLLPSDLIADAIAESKKTIEKGVAQNPDASKKAIIKAFTSLGIEVAELELFLEHPVAQCTAAEIANLRTIYKSISDGNSRWAEYLPSAKDPEVPTKVKTSDLNAKLKPTPAADFELSTAGLPINDGIRDCHTSEMCDNLLQDLTAAKKHLKPGEFEFIKTKIDAKREELK